MREGITINGFLDKESEPQYVELVQYYIILVISKPSIEFGFLLNTFPHLNSTENKMQTESASDITDFFG